MQRSMGLMLVVGILIIFGVFVFADSLTPVGGGGKTVNDSANKVANTSMQAEILVRFNHELWNTTALQSAANASHAHIGAVVVTDYAEMGLSGLQLVRLPPGMMTEEGIAYYQTLPYVEYAEPNAVYSIESTTNQTVAEGNTSVPETVTGNSSAPEPVRLLVQFNVQDFPDVVNLSAYANQTHASLNATLQKDYTPDGLFGLHLVLLSANMTQNEGIKAYNNQTSVLFAEPDYQMSIANPVKK